MRRDPLPITTRCGAALVLGLILVTAVSLTAQPHLELRKRGDVMAVPGEYVLLYQAGAETQVRTLHAAMGAKVVRKTSIGEAVIDTVAVSADRTVVLEKYGTAKDFIELIEPNYLYYPSRDAKDDKFSLLWALKNEGQDIGGIKGKRGADISAAAAWDQGIGSDKVVIAVIDTGVDWRHRDLKDRIWRNTEEKEGNDRDNDNNGYRNDVRGWDFGDNDNDPTDTNGHGTHVAGTIGAMPNNKHDISGVMWDVRLMALKAMDQNRRMRLDALAAAVAYAVDKKAHVINASWGGSGNSKILRKVIEDAHRANILFVAAAGNDSLDNDNNATYPANYPIDNIISVAATGLNDERPGWSNYGKKTVHVGAPGVRILSLLPGDKIAYSDGTSMAAPHVSGIAGLLLSRRPDLKNTAIKDRILRTVDAVPSLKDGTVTGGRVNASRALK